MARDIRDEIEGLFKAAAEDPSIGDAPKMRNTNSKSTEPPASKKSSTTNAGTQPPAGKPRAPTTAPPASPTSSPVRKASMTIPPGTASGTATGATPKNGNISGATPAKKSASMLTPESLRKSGTSGLTQPPPLDNPKPGSGATGGTASPGRDSKTGSSIKAYTPTQPPIASPRDTLRPQPSMKPVTQPPAPASSGAKRKGKNLELIDYAPDEPLVDHKGRSKPMYKARSPRPASWRPSKVIRLFLGLFPGTRVMALETVAQGWPYTVLGVLAIVPAIFLMLHMKTSAQSMATLAIDPQWLLLQALAVLVLFCVFELLRLGSFFEERIKGPRVPRILATFTVPAALVLIGAPEVVRLAPRLVEAAWCASLVLMLGGLAGTAWCVLEGSLEDDEGQRSFRIAGIALIAVAVVAGVLTGVLSPSTMIALGAWTKTLGFSIVPALLGA